MRKLLLLLFALPLFLRAQLLNKVVPVGSRVFIVASDMKTEEFAKQALFQKHLYLISKIPDSAQFIIKFNLTGVSLNRFTGYADFIDKKTNAIIFTTKSVNSFFATNHTGMFDYREGVIDKLINRRIYPEYLNKNKQANQTP